MENCTRKVRGRGQTVPHLVVAVLFNHFVELCMHLFFAHATPFGLLLGLHAGHAGGKVGVKIVHFDSLHDLFVIKVQQEWVAGNLGGGEGGSRECER